MKSVRVLPHGGRYRLEAEGLLDGLEWRLDHPDLDDDAAPVLLAVSDNGPEMRSGETRAFMALLSIGQYFGRPYIPTDQAWIETLWGHVKAENPHLLAIDDPPCSPPSSNGYDATTTPFVSTGHRICDSRRRARRAH